MPALTPKTKLLKNSRKLLLGACVAAAVTVLAWDLLLLREPSYQGKPLSYWLGGEDPDFHGLLNPAEENEAKVALEAMGRPCVRRLTKMIAAHSAAPDLSDWPRLHKWFRRSGLERRYVARESTLYHGRDSAEGAFGILGPKAASAVPDLIVLLEDRDVNVRESAAKVLAYIGPGARSAVPSLVRCLNDVWLPVKDGAMYHDSISFTAYHALNAIPHEAALEVPVLIENLRRPVHPDSTVLSLNRLARAGESARGAAPAVLPFLSDSDPGVRAAATNCLSAITPAGLQANERSVPVQ